MVRHVLDIDDLTAQELSTVLSMASQYKVTAQAGELQPRLQRQTLGMLFEKPSTRTRVSFETAMTQLGGHAIFLGKDDIQLGRGEPLKDTARALSGYVDFLMARVFDHDDIAELAAYASVPVINGLSDMAHPTQTLADLLTIKECCGELTETSVTWIGDGNNVAQSLVLGAALTGLELTIVTPPGYGVDQTVLDRATAVGTPPTVTTELADGLQDPDVIYTDVWVSMGAEDERADRLAAFDGYQVTMDLLEQAGSPRVLHCLPAHRGEEITDSVLESELAAVWQQAENRLHAQRGLLVWLADQHSGPQ